MKRNNKKGGIYEFLDSSHILESGNDEAITEARKRYWQTYKAAWRRNKRQQEKELTCSWNSHELKQLSEAARKHKLSKSRFIKQATLAYINTSFITPDLSALRHIGQYLEMTYNTILELTDENALPVATGQVLLETMANLERDIHASLHSPMTLTQAVTEVLQTKPDTKAVLLHLLEAIP